MDLCVDICVGFFGAGTWRGFSQGTSLAGRNLGTKNWRGYSATCCALAPHHLPQHCIEQLALVLAVRRGGHEHVHLIGLD